MPSWELCFNDFSSFNILVSYKILFVHCNLFRCVLYTGSTFSNVNMKFFMSECDERCVEDV